MSKTREQSIREQDSEQDELISQIKLIAQLVCDRKEIHEIDLKILRDHGAIGLAYHNSTSSEFKKSLKSAALEQIASERMRSVSTSEILERLGEGFNLDFVVFKGAALAYQHYDETWLRPRTDTDILISEESKDTFIRALNSMDLKKLPAIEGSRISQQMSYGKLLNGKSTINLDVHWKISNRHALANILNFHEISQDSSTFKIGSHSFKCPSNVHALILACVHRSGHHYNEERFTWLYDIHLLCTSLSNNEWKRILDITREKKISCITLDALNRCHNLLGTKVPEFVLEELESRPKSHEISAQLAQRNLAGWQVFLNDLRALANTSQRIVFIWQTVFPSAAYMKEKYGNSSLFLAYVKRALSGFRKLK